MLFTKNKNLKEIIDTQISEEHYQAIEKWKAIYAGYFEEHHQVKYNTVGQGERKRRRHSLKMGKVAAQELAKIIFTEKVDINIDNKPFNEYVHDVLKSNRFNKVFQSKLEQMFALGGLVLKANPKELPDQTYKLSVSYVTPDCFIPISWENELVTEAAFLTITRKDKKIYCLFEIHRWKHKTGEDGETVKVLEITNELYEGDDNSIEATVRQVPLATLYPELEEKVSIENLTKPLFQYISPNIANNFDLQSPLGISIYANALDTLYAIDVAFDSFIREFRLGRRRILVPASALRTVIDPLTGDMVRYFDADDEVYEGLNYQDPDKQQIKDTTVPLRVDEHIAAINALLNLYALQIGFSVGTFTFDGVGIKTATEVVSENSKTYQTKQVNEESIEEGLRNFIHTIGEVSTLYDIFTMPDDYDMEFYWDDTIVKDKYTDSDFYIKLKNAGLMPAYRVLMKILDLTEEEAKEWVEEVRQDNITNTPDINDIIGGRDW